jgi:hypothetical protein
MKNALAILLLLLTSSGLCAADLTTSDFAAGYYLEVENGGPMYILQLSEDIYRTVRRPDLGDIRVFNGAGEAVPHSLRAVDADPQTVGRKDAVPFFPYDQSSLPVNRSDLSLHVTRNSSGTIVDIVPPSPDSATPGISGYLLDLSEAQPVNHELEFFWRDNRESSMYTVSIEQSNDLVRWTSLVGRATLADLQYAGQRIERRTVQLPYKPMRYLRLTWQENGPPLELTAVTGYSRIIAARQERQWLELYNGKLQAAGETVAIDFHTDYHLPASAAQLRFPETNSIARVALQSRANDKAGWITRCEQVFYSLTLDGTGLQNEPCTFPPTADPIWRLAVREDGAGLRSGNRVPTLQIGWFPSELVFLGRGAPPYLLAFGSGRLEQRAKNNDSDMIFQALRTESGSRITSRAVLGKRIALGGESVLQPPAPARPWKKWLLWTVLILGVGLLAVLARNLMGEMNKEDKTGRKENL